MTSRHSDVALPRTLRQQVRCIGELEFFSVAGDATVPAVIVEAVAVPKCESGSSSTRPAPHGTVEVGHTAATSTRTRRRH